ncbi:hypothetical protein ROA7450_00506 [Roseovarius albus]|uniref:Uncharacterized protein n=1 Tax=Roseovarius albus TaxID=1247867 RepID=A0A1X6YC30_9RHOB|nr:hypothetical protein [Roseovarius albus]SLN17023.1 hypothetical protein ROA7450_00506 [Roseovarius albus]
MPIDKLVLIIVVVIAAAGATIWLSLFVAAFFQFTFGWLILAPVGLVIYVIYRVIAERVGNAEEDHYDNMDH